MDRPDELGPRLALSEWRSLTDASVGRGELATGQRREEVLVGGVERVCDGQHDEAAVDAAQDDRRSSRRAGDDVYRGVRFVLGDLDAVGDPVDAHGPVAWVVVDDVRVVAREECPRVEVAFLDDVRSECVHRVARLQVEQVDATSRRRVQSVLAVTRARAVPAHDRAHERLLLHVPNVAPCSVDQCHLRGDNTNTD